MSARDIYHDHVRKALERDGWRITSDPLHLQWAPKICIYCRLYLAHNPGFPKEPLVGNQHGRLLSYRYLYFFVTIQAA
jgi:hypothetical protein